MRGHRRAMVNHRMRGVFVVIMVASVSSVEPRGCGVGRAFRHRALGRSPWGPVATGLHALLSLARASEPIL